MKKLTKIFSMALAIAMTLSVTAMAASYAGTPATYENSPNRNAYLNYLVANGKNTIYDRNTMPDLEDPSNDKYYYKLLAGYYSPIGAPIVTREYLVNNFGYQAANAWVDLLSNAVSRAGCYCKDLSKCTCDITTADDVNDYMNYLLTGGLDGDFITMKTIYGEAIAEKFATHMTNSIYADKQNWPTIRADYIKANTKFNNDGTYVDRPDNLIPLDAIAAADAFATNLTNVIVAAVPDTSEKAMHFVLFTTNLYPLDHEKSVTNGRTISDNEAIEITKGILLSDDPDMGAYGTAYNNVANAINAARNGKVANILEDKIVDNKDTIPTTNVTITADGKPVTLEAVILTNSHGGATTYFKVRDLAPIMNGTVDYSNGRIKIRSTKNYYEIKPVFQPITAENKDSRTSIITVNIDTQLEAVVLSNEHGGATTYFKLRDIAALMNYTVNWDATTGISVTDMYPQFKNPNK